MHRVDNMPKRFRSIKANFDHVFRGTTAERARTVICGNYVNGNMGFAVSKLYIKKYFDDNARNQVKNILFYFIFIFYSQSFEMISNIRKSFIDMVNKSKWMDNVSKSRAIEKVGIIQKKN